MLLDIKNTFSTKYDGIIVFWALAECGLGGFMHAMMLPFTGIAVGGIATICIFLIAAFSQEKTKHIIEATAMVVMIKMIVSPHSPWQAYVAILFQMLSAILLLTGKKIYPWQAFLFAILTQIESAIQKIVIMVLLFGRSFFNALDASMHQIAEFFKIHFQGNIIISVFLIYLLIHLIIGILLGIWLPNIQNDVSKLKISNEFLPKISEKKYPGNNKLYWWVLSLIFTIVLVAWNGGDLWILVLLRLVIITLGFMYIVTPIVKFFVRKYFSSRIDDQKMQNIIDSLPNTLARYKRYIAWANKEYRGVKKIKYILLAVIYASIHPDEV